MTIKTRLARLEAHRPPVEPELSEWDKLPPGRALAIYLGIEDGPPFPPPPGPFKPDPLETARIRDGLAALLNITNE